MSKKGCRQTPEHARKKGLSRRQEYCKKGHFLAETRWFDEEGKSHGCGICKSKTKITSEAKHRSELKYKFGLTIGEYEEILRRQNGSCAICGMLPENQGSRYKRLAVDHDHEKGRIRGLLCDRCNRGIGLLGDSPEILREAVTYLENV